MLAHLSTACAQLAKLLQACGDRMLDGDGLTESGIQLALSHFVATQVNGDDATLKVHTEYAVTTKPSNITRYADLVVTGAAAAAPPLMVVEIKYARLGYLKRLAWSGKRPQSAVRDRQLAEHRAALREMPVSNLLQETIRVPGSASNLFRDMEAQFVTGADQARDELSRFSRHWGAANADMVYALVLVIGERVLVRQWDAAIQHFEDEYQEYELSL